MGKKPDSLGWLPASREEMERLGWDAADVILITGDAYVDHPAFGTAVIARLLEAEGLRVAVVPQPNWLDDLRDFRKLGPPRLFFAVTAGSMDSMVNHYTAGKRRRSDDAYTPGGKAGFRPDYAATVYTRILKKLYPGLPVVLGGIEASLRRVTHYDYWSDRLMPSILADSGADLLFYGMAEEALSGFVRLLLRGVPFHRLTNIPQTAFLTEAGDSPPSRPGWETVVLASHENCLADKKSFARNFRILEEESNRLQARQLIQHTGSRKVVVNPPCPPPGEQEMDRIYSLPFTRLPHPRYRGKGAIPAYEMIRHSVTLHRGCFGGCAFCTISAHQGKFISSRSEASIIQEVDKITRMEDFRGYISDLGGPSANMYRMKGIREEICRSCSRPSCIFPAVCPNLDTSHQPLIDLYRLVRSRPGVKKAFIGSGIRYDLFLTPTGREETDRANREYLCEVIRHHVSGRLKVAPEHTAGEVLRLMRKPSFNLFETLNRQFRSITAAENKKLQLIPYFISSHPGCNLADMAGLAAKTRELDFRLEQVQDFTPTPMTLATEIFYSGIHPYTLEPVYSARTEEERRRQRQFFFWHKREYRAQIIRELRNIGREEFIKQLFG